jgi:hypothetical protein
MKIRNGFVSNSSSSSFVVVFPQIPVSDIDVLQMMFGNPSKIRGVSCYEDEGASVYDVACRVFDDLSKQRPNNRKLIFEALSGYEPKWGGGTEKQLFEDIVIPGYGSYDDEIKRLGLKWESDREEINKIFDKHQKKIDQVVKKMMKLFMDKHKDEFVYVFEYGDHNGNLEMCCEQGDIFRFLPHIKINNH